MKENSQIKQARKLLLGTVLGDSNLSPRSNEKALLTMAHSDRQAEFMLWKAKILMPLVGKFTLDKRDISLKGKLYPRTQLRTLSSKYLKHIYNDIYFSGKKEIKSNVLNKLTPISIAAWYGDDGNLSPYGAISLFTHRYSVEEIENICRYFKDKFNVLFNIYPHNKNSQFIMKTNKAEGEKFLAIVRPYLKNISCFLHKIEIGHSARLPYDDVVWDDDIIRTAWQHAETAEMPVRPV